ncbi:hypothetical protein BWZ20_04150 [Winogradskyella sp. J14-2]|uniref:glycosyltransferase n=1 Tax=Winogradskyella sp. J14-2 TaxID=1936080 RepID=UPI000972AAD0|nr:glycosyltransferase [Winogradskyella sp. J14-2]APY07536.1 hypothetical protein BWZ20_04150 [Winogradskyella sp. J14-2]
MRVLQLIDTLDAGGAERMAVNLANALSGSVDASYLCATRKEGLLKESLDKDVRFLFLKKKGTFDIKAMLRLHAFIKSEKINIIHAHSSSFFLATLVSLFLNNIKVIWHDHYGDSEYLSKRPRSILKLCSYFFSHSFAVNDTLLQWAKKHLNNSSVSYLPNFIIFEKHSLLKTKLKGQRGKRIVCLANLRPQKDHFNLIEAFSKIEKKFPEYTLHCVGASFNDDYSKKVYSLVKSLQLSHKVFFYGSCADVKAMLSHCNIGVLSSKSEGLPLALLEYGEARLAVAATNVGDCKKVVRSGLSGLLVPKENSVALAKALEDLITNKIESKNMGLALRDTVYNKYSQFATLKLVLGVYNN